MSFGLSLFWILVIPLGLEPKAYCLEGSCSIQLSYGTDLCVLRCKGSDYFGIIQIFAENSIFRYLIIYYKKELWHDYLVFCALICTFVPVMKEVIVKDSDLQRAAMEGMDQFIRVFVDAIREAIGGELTAENMGELNVDQITLLAWDTLHEEVMDGGFVQLIHNGYGMFIFKNPFAKALNKLWGMRALSKMLYEVHTLWLKYREEIEVDCSEDEFMAMFERFPEFDDFDDQFIEHEEEWTDDIAHYIDDHLDRFAVISEE